VHADMEGENGTPLRVFFYHPVLLVDYVLQQCPNLRRIYAEAAIRDPCSQQRPWKIVLGCDEHTPGSKVNHDNRRKSMVLSFNFENLGRDALETDATWFVPLVVQTTTIGTISGGWSVLLREFLRHLLIGPRSFSGAGILVHYTFGVNNTVCSKLVGILSQALTDGEGLQKCLQWRGQASMRPDFVHSNVYSSATMADEAAGYVTTTCVDEDKFRQWSRAGFDRNFDECLAAWHQYDRGEINKTHLNELQKAGGYNSTPNGLLADLQLRAQCDWRVVWRYDWMHTAFQDGFMSCAMWLVLSSITDNNYNSDYGAFKTYLRQCQYPLKQSSACRQLYRLFEPKMVSKHNAKSSIVANASSQFSLYPIVHEWALGEAGEGGPLQQHVLVYVAACEIIDILKQIKYRRASTSTSQPKLVAAVSRWQRMHIALYGGQYFKPKSFWIRSIAMRIDRSEYLFDMWTVERLHQGVRLQLELVRNTITLEKSSLRLVLDARIATLMCKSFSVQHIVGRSVDSLYGTLGDSCVSFGFHAHVDEVVVHESGKCGIIVECISNAGLMYVKV